MKTFHGRVGAWTRNRLATAGAAGRMVAVFLLLALILAVPAASWARPTGKAAAGLSLRAPVNDIGFKPEVNGFSFENYGSDEEPVNMTEADVRRLFGDEACTIKSGGKLVLTPTARQWMEEINEQMADGHCEGMAALSLMFYTGQEDVNEYGADNAYGLSFDNEDLQSEIAMWWATQAVDPTESSVIKGAPTDILQTLQSGMSRDGETYTLGIYKSDGSGGHAVTPYAVEDDGGGKYRILVYDNNYPGEARAVEVDANTESWSYEASTNPEEESELYEGDDETGTMDLTPTSARLQTQSAPFARTVTAPAYAGLGLFAPQANRYNQLFLDGRGHLLITNEQGQRLGYADGALVNEIPGAKYTRLKTQSTDGAGPEPLYWTPEDMTLSVTINGTGLASASPTDLVMVGPGFVTGIEGIELEPGQEDFAVFSPTDQAVTYETDRTASPNFVVAVDEETGAGYYFEIQGARMEGGGAITAVLDTKEKDLLLNTEKLKNEGTFNLVMTRIDDKEEVEVAAEGIKLPAGALVYMDYGDWKSGSKTVEFGVDLNGDGNIDEVYQADLTEKGGGGTGVPVYVWIIIAAAVVLVVAALVVLLVRRRSGAAEV